MHYSFKNLLCTCVLALMCSFVNAQQFKALLVTETAGWQHESSFDAIPAVRKLAARHDFKVDLKQKAMPLNNKQLANYDVIIMINTTGDVFNDTEQAAVEKFIQSGKGWVGVHAASDTEYDWKWYTDMVGHMFKIPSPASTPGQNAGCGPTNGTNTKMAPANLASTI
jgi:type 1 glutamine amidotransferase